MRKRTFWKALAVGLLWSASLTAEDPKSGDVCFMNDRELRIPVNLQADARKDVEKLMLYLSTDQGKSWRQEVIIPPTDDSFEFRAPQDGVYWFKVSFRDKQGRTFPSDADFAMNKDVLKVVIDTRKPAVKLDASERKGELVNLAWDAQDENIDPTRVKLEYRTSETSPWRPLALTALTGQKRFALGATGPVQVRLVAIDQANNETTKLIDVPEEKVTTTVASAPPTTTGMTPQPITKTVSTSNDTPSVPSSSMPLPPAGTPTSLIPPNSSVPSSDSFRPVTPPTNPSTGMAPSVPSSHAPSSMPLDDKKPIANSSSTTAPTSSVPTMPTQPPLAGGTSTQQQGPLASSTNSYTPKSPTDANFLITNQLHHELEFDVTKAGPSGIGVVELWVTQDKGRNWSLLSKREDGHSPIGFDLPGEGEYGFTMIVRSKAGLGKEKPDANQAPELRVEVDTTPPIAELYNVEADPRNKNYLFLIWNAKDKNLGQNPITIEWAESKEGPWQPIISDWANAGRYAWKMPERLPYRIYLRLKVRDQAGNVSVAETPQPVLVDLTEPEVRIKGLVPAIRKP